MYIHKLSIKEFGALRDREFRLAPGINLFEGNNESGKSTLLAFIRFMLYGMPRRVAGETVSERERGLNWQSGIAEGSMELSKDGKKYRIERRGALRSSGGHDTYSETCSVYDAESGEEILIGEIPGKALLGISADVFTGTACIRQLECTAMNSDEINSSIENLLFSASEEIDTQKIQAKLDDMRRTLLYKNGKGGRIFELESTKKLLEDKLVTAKQNAETIIAKEASVEHYREVIEKAKRQNDEADAARRLYETATTLTRFETLHAHEAKQKEAENALQTLCREKGYCDALPDRETLAAIDRFGAALGDAVQSKAMSEVSLRAAEGAGCGDRELADFYTRAGEAGGSETVCAAFLHARKRRRGASLRALICLILAVLGMGIGILALVTELLAPFASSIPYFSYIAIGTGVLLSILGILSLSSASGAKKQGAALLRTIGMSLPSTTEAELVAHIEKCRESFELCRKYDTELTAAKTHYDECAAALEKTTDSTAKMLLSIGVSSAEGEHAPEKLSALMKKTYADFLAVCNEKEQIESRLDSLSALISELQKSLGDQNEASLAAILGQRTPHEVLEGIDIEKVNLAYQYSKTQHTLGEQKRLALEKELIALTSTAENPARVEAKLSETTEELARCRMHYNALVMAHETLGRSSENLRRNVTPRLRIRAGEIMEKLTGGKYGTLGVSPEMKITVLTDGVTRDIEQLSKGTRDAAYIALRIALAELICHDAMPPLFFDESFAQLDETRTHAMLNMLFEYTGDHTQSLIFTCHRREGEMLRRIGNFNDVKLK